MAKIAEPARLHVDEVFEERALREDHLVSVPHVVHGFLPEQELPEEAAAAGAALARRGVHGVVHGGVHALPLVGDGVPPAAPPPLNGRVVFLSELSDEEGHREDGLSVGDVGPEPAVEKRHLGLVRRPRHPAVSHKL